MEYIKLTDKVKLSRVIAGCMRIADSGIEGESLLAFVEECLAMGVTTFDHAPVYGGYTCEKRFGDAVLRAKPELRNKMQIVTKTGIVLPGKNGNKTIYYESTKAEIEKELEESLQNLGTDYVDLLLIHRPDILGNPEEIAETLDYLVTSGKVLSVGVSNYTPAQINTLQSYLKTQLVTNQVELSAKATTNFFNGTIDDALFRKMPLMAWSPLGGGSIFSGESEQEVRLRTKLESVAEEYKTTIDVIMYAWLFRHPVKAMAITGTMNIKRLKRSIEALDIFLTYDEWYGILEASQGYPVP